MTDIGSKDGIRLIDFSNSILPKKKWQDVDTFELGIKISENIIAKGIIPIIFNSRVHEKSSVRQYKGFDFVTLNGEKINVKSGMVLGGWKWIFVLRYDNYKCSKYLCIGYKCNKGGYIAISHIWLIPSIDFDSRIVKSIRVEDSLESLSKFSKYDISELQIRLKTDVAI